MTFNNHDYMDEVKKQAWKYTIQKLRNTYMYLVRAYILRRSQKYLIPNFCTII